jgi:WD40 repeat protein
MMAQEMEGTYIAVAGKLSDRVRSRVLRLLHPEAAYSNTMATGEIDGTPIVVSGDFRARVRVWDLRAGIECKLPLRRRTRKIVAVAVGEVDGDPVTIAGGFGGIRDSRGLVRLWDLRTGQTRGEPLRGHSTFVNAVAIGEADGIPIAVSGDADGTVQVWDLRTGQARGRPLRGHTGWVEAVAVGKFDGIPVAASGDNNGAILMWTLDRDQHAVVRLNARWELVLSYLLTGLAG